MVRNSTEFQTNIEFFWPFVNFNLVEIPGLFDRVDEKPKSYYNNSHVSFHEGPTKNMLFTVSFCVFILFRHLFHLHF